MKCNILIIFVLFLFQELNSKSLPLATESVCTLTEAANINSEYVEIISSICAKATIEVNDNVNGIKDDLDQTEQELSGEFLKVLDSLEAEINEAQEKAQENGSNQVLNCLTILTAHVNTVKDRYNNDSLSCLLDRQKEEAKIKTKHLTKIEKKIKSIEKKSAQSLGKCSIKFGPLSFGSCSSLSLCCESVKDRLVEKIGLYTRKLDDKISELLSENRECYQEVLLDGENAVGFIKQLVAECNALQVPPHTDFDEPKQSNEDDSNNEPEINQSDNYNKGGGKESSTTNGQDSQQQTKDQETDKPGLNCNERPGQEESLSQSGSGGPNGSNDQNDQKMGIQGTNKSEVSPKKEKPDQSEGNNGSNGNDDGQSGQETHQPAVEQKPNKSGCNSVNCQNNQVYVQDINQSKVSPNEGVNKESNGNNNQDGYQIVSQGVNQPKTNLNAQLVGLNQGGSKGFNGQNGLPSEDSNQDVNSGQSQPNNQDDQQSTYNQGGEGFSQSKAGQPLQIDSSQYEARPKSQYEGLTSEQAETSKNTPNAKQTTAGKSNQTQAERPAHSEYPLTGSTQTHQSQAENVEVKQQRPTGSLKVPPPKAIFGQAKVEQKVETESSGTEHIQATVFGEAEAARVNLNAGQATAGESSQTFKKPQAERPAYSEYPPTASTRPQLQQQSQAENIKVKQQRPTESLEVAPLKALSGQAKAGQVEAARVYPNAGQATAGESNQTVKNSQAERPVHSKYPLTAFTQPQAENVNVNQQEATESLEVASLKALSGQTKAGQQVKAESVDADQIQATALGVAEVARVNQDAGQAAAGEFNQTIKNPQAERPAHFEYPPTASTQQQLEQQSQAENAEVKQQGPTDSLEVASLKALSSQAKAGQQVKAESSDTGQIQATVLGQAEAARVNAIAGQATAGDSNQFVTNSQAEQPAHTKYPLTASTQPQLERQSQTENVRVKQQGPTESLEVAPSNAIFGKAKAEQQVEAERSGAEQIQGTVLGQAEAGRVNSNAGQSTSENPNQAVQNLKATSRYPPTASTQPQLKEQPTESPEVASPADEAELQPQGGVLGRPIAATENPNAGHKPPEEPNQAVKDFQAELFAPSEYPPTASTQPGLVIQTQTGSLDAKHQTWSAGSEVTPSVAYDARRLT